MPKFRKQRSTPPADAAPAPPKERFKFECRACGCRRFNHVYTRPRNGFVVRVWSCWGCGKRITTQEKEVGVPYTEQS